MGARHYDDKTKAKAYAELAVNDGNVKRTARVLGIPPATIRRWKQEWEREGVSQEILEEAAPVISEFLDDAVRIRHKLLKRIEEMVENGQGTMAQVSTAFGIVSDKIRAYEALSESKRVEHALVLPPAEELRELFSGLIGGVVDSARTRAAEIEAIEEPVAVTTYRELPVAEEDA